MKKKDWQKELALALGGAWLMASAFAVVGFGLFQTDDSLTATDGPDGFFETRLSPPVVVPRWQGSVADYYEPRQGLLETTFDGIELDRRESSLLMVVSIDDDVPAARVRANWTPPPLRSR